MKNKLVIAGGDNIYISPDVDLDLTIIGVDNIDVYQRNGRLIITKKGISIEGYLYNKIDDSEIVNNILDDIVGPRIGSTGEYKDKKSKK